MGWNDSGIYTAGLGPVAFGASADRVLATLENPPNSGVIVVTTAVVITDTPLTDPSTSALTLQRTSALPSLGTLILADKFNPSASNALAVVRQEPTAIPASTARLGQWILGPVPLFQIPMNSPSLIILPGSAVGLFAPALANHTLGAWLSWMELPIT